MRFEFSAPRSSMLRQKTPWLLFAGLLFWRLPLLVGVTCLSEKVPGWLDPALQIGTYLLMAFLIWWERERLADFHIDALALAIIILFKPAQTLVSALWRFDSNALTFPNLPSLVCWAIAVALSLALWSDRRRSPTIRAKSFAWLGIGILAGSAMTIVPRCLMSFQVESALVHKAGLAAVLVMVAQGFVYQLGYAAVAEEPLFRGFLWGYLRKAGWREGWIWPFQAVLFTLGHAYYLDEYPIAFWAVVPAGALVAGLLAWRSRSIAASMAAHGAVNALGYAVGYIFAQP